MTNSAEHARTPWRIFTNDDGTKLVGIGCLDGEGVLDAGFGVWAWNDPEGIANAAFIVKSVNNHDALVKALQEIEALGSRAPLGFAAQMGNIAHAALIALRTKP